VDHSLVRSLNDWFSASRFRTDLDRVLAIAPLIITAVLGVVAWNARRSRDPRRRATLILGGLGAVIALGINAVLGHLYFRARPFLVISSIRPLLPRPPDSSLYSDHLAVAGALVTALLLVHRPLGLAGVALAVLLAVGRVGAGVHYPSDCLIGVAAGATFFLVVLPLRNRLSRVTAAFEGEAIAPRVKEPTGLGGFVLRHAALSLAIGLLLAAGVGYGLRALQDHHWMAAAERAESQLVAPRDRTPPPEYHAEPIADLAGGQVRLTHAAVVGTVTQVTNELDGDVHIRIRGPGAFIVAEVMPELPLSPPRVGQAITAWGVVRHDGIHNWWELHPLVGWRAGNVITGANRSSGGGD
jgi:undecaprenyl-diphosphatase